MIMHVHGTNSFLVVNPDKLPIKKEVMLMVKSVFKSLIVLIPAFKKEEIVIPAKIMVVLELSDKEASKKMEMVVRSAPRKAKSGVRVVFAGKRSMESITKKPEPEFTPMVFGLARELFMTFCKITPEEASPIPAKRPPRTRGIRTVVIKRYAVVPTFFLPKAAIMSFGAIITLPKDIPAMTAKISKINKSNIVIFLCFFMKSSLFETYYFCMLT